MREGGVYVVGVGFSYTQFICNQCSYVDPLQRLTFFARNTTNPKFGAVTYSVTFLATSSLFRRVYTP